MTSRSGTPRWRPRAVSVEVPDRELRELGGHRLALDVRPDRAPAARPVRRPARRWRPPSSPAGTSIRKVNVALSRGWSLDGKMWCARSGCGAVAEPSGVDEERGRLEARRRRLGRRRREVRDADDEQLALAERALRGVITSSSPSRRQGARAAVDRDRRRRSPREVEVEARERLRRARERSSRCRRSAAPARSWRSAGRGRSAGRRSRRCRAAGTAGRARPSAPGDAAPARCGRRRRRDPGTRMSTSRLAKGDHLLGATLTESRRPHAPRWLDFLPAS